MLIPGGPESTEAPGASQAQDRLQLSPRCWCVDAPYSHTASDFLEGTHEFKLGVQTAPWNTATALSFYASTYRIPQDDHARRNMTTDRFVFMTPPSPTTATSSAGH